MSDNITISEAPSQSDGVQASAGGESLEPNTARTPLPQLGQTDLLRSLISQAVGKVRNTTPLAQSFTNFVTINLVANAQLASGGTAAMSFLPDDILETAKISGAEYINVGTLLPFFAQALPQIAEGLQAMGKPWVLDPVAAGIGSTRTAILTAMRDAPPSVIRANASETIALCAMWGLDADGRSGGSAEVDGGLADDVTSASGSRETKQSQPVSRPAGVESVDDVDEATNAALALARFLTRAHDGKAAVAVSGAVDLVTDGERIYRLEGGSAMMEKITGAGCALGGVLATYLAVADPLVAALAASLHFNRAGEVADRICHGPGSFQSAFLDALWNTTAQTIAASPIAVANA